MFPLCASTPIVPEPHCFTYPNSALRDNPKPNACKIFKEMVKTEAPQNSNTVNADGMFLNLLYAASVIVSLCKKLFCLFCLFCLIYADVYESLPKTQKDTKRKKEEMNNLIVFFTLVQKQKCKQACMICYSFLVLRKS